MSRFNAEKGFISKLVETKDMLLVKDLQIKPSYFIGDNRKVFSYMQNQFAKFGEVPTERIIKSKFPNFDLEIYECEGEKRVGTEEPLRFWCDEVRTRAKHNKIVETIETVVLDLESANTEEAYAFLKKQISYIENEIVETTTVDITKDTEDRKKSYLERKNNKGMIGIPTGIKGLDMCLKGLTKSTLTTVIASTGVGKTWLEILVGAYCQLQNYRVLHFVTEMSEDIMQDRYEAMLFGMMCGEFSYSAFKSGSLSPEIEKKYFDFLDNDLPNLEPLYIKTATGVMGIGAEIENHKPDLVMIDGAYLMEDDSNADSDWLRVSHITRDLKKLSKRTKTPILINTQADQNTSKKTGPNLGDIKYSQAIGMDSDNVIAMYRDELMMNDHEMCIKVIKQREGIPAKIMLNWDFQHMNFSDIYSESVNTVDSEVTNKIIGVE